MKRMVYNRKSIIARSRGDTIPPTRLCVCGHIYHVHRFVNCGVCRRLELPECAAFREDRDVPKLAPAGASYLSSGRILSVHRKHRRAPK